MGWIERIAAAAAVGATVASPAERQDAPPPREVPPATLRETGLYADWDAAIVAPDHLPFAPQYPLWSDGATKRRWIHLPPGAAIDASDPDAWVFPIGTRIWKEFSFARRVETRYLERTAAGWIFAAYAWSDDGREATLVPASGLVTDVEVAPGERHTIPGEPDCRVCHGNGPTPVLGFSALQLSPDRDPNAPHREATPPGAVDLVGLVERGLLRGVSPRLLEPPPRIAARSPTERAALGYLHANCGNCHRPTGPLASLDLTLAYSIAGGAAALDAIGHRSRFVPPGAHGPALHVTAGAPGRSVVVARMASRDPFTEMPPLGSRRVDQAAVRLIADWIEELTPQPTSRGD